MKKSELYKYVLDYFRGIHPEVTTELEFGSVFQLLVAVVLSAQCTDKRVNQVTPELFAHYPDARSMAETDEFEVYEYVKSVSYPNAKARHLVELARMIQNEYGGEVPHDFDSLLRLPGVRRGCDARRHACVPCEPPPRTRAAHGRHAAEGGAAAREAHTC